MRADELPAHERETPEERLGRIAADCSDRLNAGEDVNIDALLQAHPDLVNEIRETLEILRSTVPATTATSPLGTIGDYTLRRQIGRGGMGVVYEAWENSMDRRVALKILPAGLATDGKATTRFLREAQVAGKLQHENIVRVYATGVREGTPWYSMEFVHGETLAQLIARIRSVAASTNTPFGKKGSLAYFANFADVFADVADGLEHAHSKGVTHRDIKPSNLILDSGRHGGGNGTRERSGGPSGRLRILDFGLARLEGQQSVTLSGDLVGTPLYMSPEQARRRKIEIDHRTDIYSLGATMYEAVCGRPPFQGKDYADTLSQIIERDPAEPRKVNPRVPKDLETIILKCLRKDSAVRYGTAEALGQDLRRFARGDAVEARPESAFDLACRRLRRHGWRIAISAILVAALVVSGMLAWVLWNVQEDIRAREYEALVSAALVDLELGFPDLPLEDLEGETISLGLIHPSDVSGQLALERFDGALDRLERAAGLYPGRPEALVHTYRALLALRRGDQAQEIIENALDLSGDFIPAVLHRVRRVRESDGAETADQILSALAAGVRTRWEALYLDAHRAAIRGDWNAAHEIYTRLLWEIDEPPYAGFTTELRLKRGRVALKRGAHQQALRDFYWVYEASKGEVGTALLVAKTHYRVDERSQARAVLDHTFARSPTSDTAFAVVDVKLQCGDNEAAEATIDQVSDAGLRLALQAKVLGHEGEREACVEAGLHALETGVRAPWLYEVIGEPLLELYRNDENLKLCRAALREFPDHPSIVGRLHRSLYYACDFDDFVRLSIERDPSRLSQARGLREYRTGQVNESVEHFRAAVAVYPRNVGHWHGLGMALRFVDRHPEAIDAFVKAEVVVPGGYALTDLRSYYSAATRKLLTPHWDSLEETYQRAMQRGNRSPRLVGFRALAVTYKENPDLDLALDLAQEAVRGETSAESLSCLAEVEWARGDREAAVRTLEQASGWLGCRESWRQQLALYRESLFPRLVSCASIDDWIEEETPKDLGDIRRDLRGSALEPYLEACLAERSGNSAEALRVLESLLKNGALKETAAIERLARLRNRAGRRDEALALLEKRALAVDPNRLSLWSEWLRIAAAEEPIGLESLARRLEVWRSPSATVEQQEGLLDEVTSVLDSLASGDAVRINCGGDDYVDAYGRKWKADRFADGGGTGGNSQPDVPGLVDRALLYSHRYFTAETRPGRGYRIPMPCGRYRVVLTFLQTIPGPYEARFDIVAEEDMMQREFFCPFGEIREQRFDVEVSDGLLDLEFRVDHGLTKKNDREWRRAATITSIEVSPLAARRAAPR